MHDLEEGLAEVIEVVWEKMLGLQSERTGPPVGSASGSRLIARVQWKGVGGALAIECPDALLREAAAALFSLEADAATEEDLQDTIGELINVIAGNARGLFENDPGFSLPDVDRSDAVPDWQGNKSGEVWFISDGSPFRVFAASACADEAS
ncbi:MAG: chemotaxis protein CheX [Planctomycetota bacterium]|jgi:chemotaxis protein CheX